MVVVKPRRRHQQVLNEVNRTLCVKLRQKGYSISQVAKEMSVSVSTVKRWDKRSRNTNDFADKHRSGRPKKVTKELEAKIRKMLENGKIGSLRTVQQKLAFSGIDLALSTIHDIATDSGIVYRKKPRKPFLTDIKPKE
jgi:transposase